MNTNIVVSPGTAVLTGLQPLSANKGGGQGGGQKGGGSPKPAPPNPNWPAKTLGRDSGKGRGNNQPAPKR